MVIRQAAVEWATERVATLPAKWSTGLLKRWERTRNQGESSLDRLENERAANIALRELTDQLTGLRLPLDVSDEQVRQAAELIAGRAFELASVYHDHDNLRAALVRTATAHGVRPPAEDMENGPAIARLSDPMWWRRQLRRAHGRALEGAAIVLGLVRKGRECYASNQTVQRRAQQLQQNAETLENMTAVNEVGDEFTLAELAAKGTANKAIRRAELMTRIAGFERIAQDMRHVGLFLTMTAPSRMHKFRTTGGNVTENKRYDGTTPREAQQHHVRNWARIRAALARRELRMYGFRIAEPNHDGCPHWHLLVFFSPHWPGWTERAALPRVCAIVRRYCLQDSGNERGARQHRCDFKPMDATKGTAAGYIAKYVAKNIDGYRLDKDLIGNDAISTSQRVDAWASTWGIRQFQQVGGPPVTVWRELRRIAAMPEAAPEPMRLAHAAANRVSDLETGEVKSVSWARYVKAQGGPHCGRKYRVRLMKTVPGDDGVNRYGEPSAPAPLGVEMSVKEFYTPAHMAYMGGIAERLVLFQAESTRHEWEIRPGGRARRSSGALRPWTCVNNCTHGPDMKKKPSATDWYVFEHELQIAQADEENVNKQWAKLTGQSLELEEYTPIPEHP